MSFSVVPEVKTVDEVLKEIDPSRFQLYMFFVCGISLMADAVEVCLLAFLSECLDAEWGMSNAKKGGLTSIVFAGQFIGSLIWGPVADKMGRKKVFLIALAIISVAGYASAFANNYVVLVSCRFVVGFGVGAIHIPFDIMAEFLPSDLRGSFLISVQFFWAAGALLVTGIAWACLDTLGWRVLTFISAVPMTVAFFGALFLPESPRWLVSQGRLEEATAVLNYVAQVNSVTLTPYRLDKPNSTSPYVADEMKLEDIISTKFMYRNSLVWSIWFCFGFAYYGIILFVTRVFESDSANDDSTCSFDYFHLFTSGLVEFMSISLVLLLYSHCPRNLLQTGFYTVATIAGGILSRHHSKHTSSVLSAFFRLAVRAGSATSWLATPELYPTPVRATAHAAASAMTRLGGFVCPFIVSNDSLSVYIVSTCLTISCGIASGASYLTPDTRNVVLDEVPLISSSDSDNDEQNKDSEALLLCRSLSSCS
mmetsp:Transcript_16644/g.25050  ORF Transcript_16644/g.25050 Transcript_16644/m.25050 type:complete len:480 (-) Transcript_16644:71-1510(-)